ncbi:hypothetical protein K503DRAFT_768409 [Rhizopogon vinicolor AM-OR11-026]|uniref:BHLH domain-containing protein n=1 Tax=Rhizopogon vinicolor AM-OR11-026 TaxID=1314800 RepID=A0A1B7N6Y2_9AGAM|nr:hypothetical protein K503DRAFT_768409 [Rhizopogon vinicolor AM-OR11-026]
MPGTFDAGEHTSTGRSRKRLLQRIYRSMEAEDFAQLRQIIQEITQDNPQTRHDVLIKAAEIIRQLAREYHYLLQVADQQAALTSMTSSPAAGPSMQQPSFYMNPAVSPFPPNQENWLGPNPGHQTMQIHSQMAFPDTTENIYDPTQNTGYDTTYAQNGRYYNQSG